MEEEMELMEGDVVRMCTYDEARNELEREDPGVNPEMRDYFDRDVTVSRDNGEFFYIDEDNEGWVYHKDWIVEIVSGRSNIISPKMKRMM